MPEGHNPWTVAGHSVLALGSLLSFLLLVTCLESNGVLLDENPASLSLFCLAMAGAMPLAVAFAVLAEVQTARHFFRGLSICLAAVLGHAFYTAISGHTDHYGIFSALELALGGVLYLRLRRSRPTPA